MITRSGRIQKIQIKKKKKISYATFSLAVFFISGDKKGGKKQVVLFFP